MRVRTPDALLGVRPLERRRTALLFVTLLLVVSAYTTTKAVRDAVFLARFSIASLSWLMMAVAVAAALGLGRLHRHAAERPRDRLVLEAHLVVAGSLALIALGLGLGAGPWLAWVLYLWSSAFGLFLVAEFWLLANDVLHVRQARRLYGVIGAGGILGGVVGGAVSAWATRLGAVNLLYVVSLELCVAALTARAAFRPALGEPPVAAEAASDPPAAEAPRDAGARAEARAGEPPSAPQARGASRGDNQARGASHDNAGWRLFARHRLVRALGLLTVCATVALTLAQWQWKAIARAHLGGQSDAMTAFFGGFAAALSAVSLVAQVLLTTRLLRRWGPLAAMALLPAGLALGAIAILAAAPLGQAAQLYAGALSAMLADGLRFSVEEAAVQLLWQPVGRGVRERAKPLVDTALDRLGGGLAGLLWIGLVHVGGMSDPRRLGLVSLAVLGVVAAWAVVLVRARRAYLHELSARGRAAGAQLGARDAEVLAQAALDSDPNVRRAAADLARLGAGVDGTMLDRIVARLVRRAGIRRALYDLDDPDGWHAAIDRGPDALLRRALDEAVAADLGALGRLLAHRYGEEVAAAVRRLDDRAPHRRAAALELLDHHLAPPHRGLAAGLEAALLDAEHAPVERAAALGVLLADPDPWLRLAAIEVARRLPELGPALRRSTQDPARLVREAAWRGLGTVAARPAARGAPC